MHTQYSIKIMHGKGNKTEMGLRNLMKTYMYNKK